MTDFLAAFSQAANNRQTMPPMVMCMHVTGAFRGVPCVGHADCRAAYWQRVDAGVRAAAEQARIEVGSLRPKRRIKV